MIDKACFPILSDVENFSLGISERTRSLRDRAFGECAPCLAFIPTVQFASMRRVLYYGGKCGHQTLPALERYLGATEEQKKKAISTLDF